MIVHRGRLSGILVITSLLAVSGGTRADTPVAPVRVGDPVGGGVTPEPADEHPSETQRLLIQSAIEESIAALHAAAELPEATSVRPLLTWPLLPGSGIRDPGYHVTYHLVDLDPAFPDHVLDYACGSRTYDLGIGYNHQGADYVAWPFRWTRFLNSEIAVVAAAPGTIVNKEDGTPDFDCTSVGGLWNAVYVRHADGSVAWYGHLKNGSLTAKGVGESVARGEYLGLVGSSGASSGPHLHFELHDASGDVVEPHEGPCNEEPSWWASQRPYFDSAINRLATGPALPIPFAACPGSEAPNEALDFAPDSIIYFTAYYRDQLGPAVDPGDAETRFAIYGPDGSLVTDWTYSSPADHYVGSYWSFGIYFPESAERGVYRWEALYKGVAYIHHFTIGGCLEQYPSGRCRKGSLLRDPLVNRDALDPATRPLNRRATDSRR